MAVFCLVVFAAGSAVFAAAGKMDLLFPIRLADDASVTTFERQADGKLFVAGKFVTLGSLVRRDIMRLNADGTVDTGFDIGSGIGATGSVLALKTLPNGQLYAGGTFNQVNGQFVSRLVRMNADGVVDTTFALSGLDVTFVFDIDTMPDGKIFVSATNLIGSSFIARFTSSGVNDTGFGQPFYVAGGTTNYHIVFLPAENKLLSGASVFGQSFQGVVMKMAATGGVDNGFVINLTASAGSSQLVWAAPLSDGRFLVWGRFDTIAGVPRKNLAILNANGTVDATFIPETASTGTILSTEVQADGKIIVGGRDFAPNGTLHGNIGRLNPDGTVDRSFDPGRGANGAVASLAILDGKLLVGGSFFRYDRNPAAGLVRIRL